MHKRNLKHPQVVENQQNEVHQAMHGNENSLTLCPVQLKKSYPAVPVVTVRDGQVVASSLDVAAYFGKAHRTVLRAIDGLECSTDFLLHNFVQSKHSTSCGGRVFS